MVAAREHSFTSRSPQWPMKLRNKKGLLNILFCKTSWIRWSVAHLYLHPWLWAWRSGLIPVPFFVPPPVDSLQKTFNCQLFQNSLNSIKSTRRSKCIKVARTLLHVTSTTHTMKIFPLSSMIQWLYFMSWCIFRNKLLDVYDISAETSNNQTYQYFYQPGSDLRGPKQANGCVQQLCLLTTNCRKYPENCFNSNTVSIQRAKLF